MKIGNLSTGVGITYLILTYLYIHEKTNLDSDFNHRGDYRRAHYFPAQNRNF